MRIVPLPERDDGGGIFETAADFFSLMALAAIFAVITFGSAGQNSQEVGILDGQGGVLQSAAAPDIIYVALERTGDTARATVITPDGSMNQREFDPRLVDPREIVEYVRTSLARAPNVKKVKCRLDRSEERPEIHSTFLLLLRSLQKDGFTVEAGV